MEFNIVMSVQSCTAWMFFTFIQSNNKVPERSKDGQESVPILPQRPDFAIEGNTINVPKSNLVMLVFLLKLRETYKRPSFIVAGWQGLGSNQVTTGFLVELHSSQVDRAANRQIGCILAIGGFS